MKQIHVSHAACNHPKSPKARAACRKARRGSVPEPTTAELVARARKDKMPFLELDEDPIVAAALHLKQREAVTDETPIPGLPEVTVGDVRKLNDTAADLVSDTMKILTAEACEADAAADVNDEAAAYYDLKPTVQAKGSKVIHYAADDTFACTKQPIKENATRGWENEQHPVSCKNCLKIK
jgi:hypothetical protein